MQTKETLFNFKTVDDILTENGNLKDDIEKLNLELNSTINQVESLASIHNKKKIVGNTFRRNLHQAKETLEKRVQLVKKLKGEKDNLYFHELYQTRWVLLLFAVDVKEVDSNIQYCIIFHSHKNVKLSS